MNASATTTTLPHRIQQALDIVVLHNNASDDDNTDDFYHAEAVDTIAQFLASSSSVEQQLACIDCFTSSTAAERIYVLAFCTGAERWLDPLATLQDHPVLWEIRALFQHYHQQATTAWHEVQTYCAETACCFDRLAGLYDVYQQQAAAAGPPEVVRMLCALATICCDSSSRGAEDEYNGAMQQVACYLASRSIPDPSKLALLAFVLGNTSETRLALSFVREDNMDTSLFLDNNKFSLLWELRALCLHELEQQIQRDAEIRQAGLVAADCITDTATVVTQVLRGTTALASHGLHSASQLVVEHTTAKEDDTPTEETTNDESSPSPAVALTGTIHRATDQARIWTASASRTVRTQAAQHLHSAVVQNTTTTPDTSSLIPPQHTATVHAAAHVALACVGATTMVGEAVFRETGHVCTAATDAVAAIVEHTCGAEAGQVTSHVGHSAGNLLRTVAHVAPLLALPRSVVKSTGKWHVEQQQQQQDESTKEEVESTVAVVGNPERSIPPSSDGAWHGEEEATEPSAVDK